MYIKVNRKDVIRIPPERLGEDVNELAQELTQMSGTSHIDDVLRSRRRFVPGGGLAPRTCRVF